MNKQQLAAKIWESANKMGIRTSLVKGGTEFLSVQTHAAELIDMKRTTETTDTLLLEYSRTAILTPHDDIAN